MPPFQQLFSSADFWNGLILALIGGSGFGGIIGAIAAREKTSAEAAHYKAETEKLTADAAKQAVDILTANVITPLRSQVESQANQINQLEAEQKVYFKAVAYIRALCHWLDPAVAAIEPEYMAKHPKPSLPDELRDQIGELE